MTSYRSISFEESAELAHSSWALIMRCCRQAGIVYDLGLPTCVFHADELDRFQSRKACDSNACNATARMQVNRTEPTWFCTVSSGLG
jgi:hypothetical protein